LFLDTIARISYLVDMEQLPLELIKDKLYARYQTQGFSVALFKNDWNLLIRMGVHPQIATTEDLQRIIMTAKASSTKANYASRIRSMFKALKKMGLIDNDPITDLPNVKKGRGVPHPLTNNEAMLLMTQAEQPMRDWFIIGCTAGLRAMEVANLRGIDLEQREDGYILRIAGKGGTDLSVPVSDKVAKVILMKDTYGPLWKITFNRLSKLTSQEMKRLGIPKKTFHACRHYFATNMLEKSGGDLLAVRDLMRHSSVATTQVYTQLASGRTRSLVNLL
jgi:integrase/recombinase XerD